MREAFSVEQIRYQSKTRHFEEIARETGLAYEQMLFFDHEPSNCRDVAALGVTCVYCPYGVTADAWRAGIEGFPAPMGEIIVS